MNFTGKLTLLLLMLASLLYGCSGGSSGGSSGGGGVFAGGDGVHTIPPVAGTLSGVITARSLPCSGAAVTVSGPVSMTVASAPDGSYALGSLPFGDYTVSVKKPGCYNTSSTVNLSSASTSFNQDLKLALLNRCFGGTYDDYAQATASCKDGSILVTGYTLSDKNGDIPASRHGALSSYDMWVIKADPSKPQNEQIVYNRCFGGNGDDLGNSIAECPDGCIVVTGYARSAANDGDVPATKHGTGDNYDLWVLKIDPSKPENQQIVYNRCFGGSARDVGNSIAVCPDGDIAVSGYTESNDGDINSTRHSGTGSDLWILKIRPDRSLPLNKQIVYNRCFGANNSTEMGEAIAVCPDGNILTTGYTYLYSSIKSGDVPATNNEAPLSADLWVLKINTSTNSILYNRCFGGDLDDYGYSIADGKNGIIYVTGKTESSKNSGDIPSTRNDAFGYDLWVLKIDSALDKILYNRCFGGSHDETGRSIAVCADGNIAVCGYTNSNDGDIINKHYDGDKNDFWVLKIKPYTLVDKNKQIIYNRCFGGGEGDYGYSIAEGPDSTLVTAGYTGSNDGDAPYKHGHADFWLLKIDPVTGSFSSI